MAQVTSIRCRHPEWGGKVIVESPRDVEGNARCWRDGHEGRVLLFMPGEYIVMDWDSAMVPYDQFVYNKETHIYEYKEFSVAPVKKRIFICIETCGKYWDRQRGQLDTWLSDLPEYCEYRYYVASEDYVGVKKAEGRDDVIVLPCRDGYKYLKEHAGNMVEEALRRPDWEWVVKTDDDTRIDIRRLANYMTPEHEVVHAIVAPYLTERPRFAVTGACIAMRRAVAKEVMTYRWAGGPVGAEDAGCAAILHKLGHKMSQLAHVPSWIYGGVCDTIPDSDFIVAGPCTSTDFEAHNNLLRRIDAIKRGRS